MAAAHYKLDNLCAIVDWNGLQIDGKNEDVMTVAPIDEKFQAFGFHTISIDGHDFGQIFAAFDAGARLQGQADRYHRKDPQGTRRFFHGGPGRSGMARRRMKRKQSRQ